MIAYSTLKKKCLKTSAVHAVEKNEKSFTELICSIEMRQHAVKELILTQEEAAVKQVNTLLEKLEQEITVLKSRDAELHHLESLSQADNNISFLQVSTFTKAHILKMKNIKPVRNCINALSKQIILKFDRFKIIRPKAMLLENLHPFKHE